MENFYRVQQKLNNINQASVLLLFRILLAKSRNKSRCDILKMFLARNFLSEGAEIFAFHPTLALYTFVQSFCCAPLRWSKLSIVHSTKCFYLGELRFRQLGKISKIPCFQFYSKLQVAWNLIYILKNHVFLIKKMFIPIWR